MRTADAKYLFHSSQRRSDIKKRMATQTANSRLKIWMARIGVDPTMYGSHSCRRGGATAAAAAGVAQRLLMRHGRWKSNCVQLYIVDSLLNRLSVTTSFLPQ